uniref:Uncharacterized protein n=1 Tax=Ananas comosus var. bracteatus TaxID=296719 RepID=A0A6V7QDE7_ANACO|nr:unnamed protein product [Ananas comosus var. bracteatus]
MAQQGGDGEGRAHALSARLEGMLTTMTTSAPDRGGGRGRWRRSCGCWRHRGAGGGGVHAQQRALHIHADLLRPPRQPPARRLLPRQQRHPSLRLRSHARNGLRSGDSMRTGVRGAQIRDARNIPPTVNRPTNRHWIPLAPELVDHSGGPVRLHRDEPAVPAQLDRVLVAGVHRPARVPEAVDRVGGHALLGDVVFPDPDTNSWASRESGAGSRCFNSMPNTCWVVFMISVGFNAAASVRVGNELGPAIQRRQHSL